MGKSFFYILAYLYFLCELKAQIWIDITSTNIIENGSFSYPYHNFTFGIEDSLKSEIKNLIFILVPYDELKYEMFNTFPEKYQITVISSSK